MTSTPEPSDNLTPAQRERLQAAVEWLRKKWGAETKCPYCGVVSWGVGEPVWVHVNFDAPRRTAVEHMSPAFTVMCRNCGHTSFVNAIVAGIEAPGTEAGQLFEGGVG